jgi:hypothetical protein
MKRFGGLTRKNPNQLYTLYQTAEAKLQCSRRCTGVSLTAPQKLQPFASAPRPTPRLKRLLLVGIFPLNACHKNAIAFKGAELFQIPKNTNL